MKKYKKILIGIAIALALLVLLPFLIPMQTYLQEAEKLASEKLGAPVKIGSMHVALLPTPRVNAGDIVIGKSQDIKLRKLTVVPAISTLFSDAKTISAVHLDAPEISESGINMLTTLAQPSKPSDSKSSVVVRRVTITEAKIAWPKVKIPVFDADLTLTEASALQSAELASRDDTLNLRVVPVDDYQEITLKARNWRLPMETPITFDALESNMILQGAKLQIQSLNGQLFGGALQASGVLDWQRDWKLNAKFDLKDISLVKTFQALGKKPPLTGQLFANGNVQSSAKNAGGLGDKLALDAPFKIQNGVLKGVDLLKVASLLLKSGAGGETQFDTFTGDLQMRGKQYKLSNLNVASGLLGATGHVTISENKGAPNKALSGEVKVELKKSVSLVAIPMNVSGTLDSPMVFPTKAALIGGAIGTAVLPGAGTAAGVQAAEKAEKVLKGLFGD